MHTRTRRCARAYYPSTARERETFVSFASPLATLALPSLFLSLSSSLSFVRLSISRLFLPESIRVPIFVPLRFFGLFRFCPSFFNHCFLAFAPSFSLSTRSAGNVSLLCRPRGDRPSRSDTVAVSPLPSLSRNRSGRDKVYVCPRRARGRFHNTSLSLSPRDRCSAAGSTAPTCNNVPITRMPVTTDWILRVVEWEKFWKRTFYIYICMYILFRRDGVQVNVGFSESVQSWIAKNVYDWMDNRVVINRKRVFMLLECYDNIRTIRMLAIF